MRLPDLPADDARLLLSEAARLRIEKAEVEAEAIGQEALCLATDRGEDVSAAERATRLSRAKIIISAIAREFINIGKRGKDLRLIMEDYIDAISNSAGLGLEVRASGLFYTIMFAAEAEFEASATKTAVPHRLQRSQTPDSPLDRKLRRMRERGLGALQMCHELDEHSENLPKGVRWSGKNWVDAYNPKASRNAVKKYLSDHSK